MNTTHISHSSGASTRRGRHVVASTVACVLLALTVSVEAAAQIQTNVPGLKTVFAKDFYIGCLLSYRHIGFADDPVVPGQSAVQFPYGGDLIRFHMNNMSPGNNMKPENTLDITASAAAYTAAATQAEKDSIDVHPIMRFIPDMIAQLNWAQRQGFTFRGHTIVWHNQTPAAFFRSGYTTGGARLSPALMTARLENYIRGLIQLLHANWPGMVNAMDVVNEALTDGGVIRSSGNEWYTTYGNESYIDSAFAIARRWTVALGEPQIKLYYNDYNTYVAAKATGIARVCSRLYRAGNLDGIGMQEHDNLSAPTAAQWVLTYSKFDTVCSEMAVTEFDVATGSATPSAAVLAQQANQYGLLFKCFVARSMKSGRGKIIDVSKDGLNDASTFQSNTASSLWDGNYQCKPAFYAVVNVGYKFNALDSLLRHADSLSAANFTPASWATLSAAVTAGRTARDQNYTITVSADTALGVARDNLQAALDALVLTGVVDQDRVARIFGLSQNYPNPFNPVTQLSYDIASAGPVSLKIYDMLGNEVATLASGARQPGHYTASFDGSGLASGVYLARLTAGSSTATRKLLLVR